MHDALLYCSNCFITYHAPQRQLNLTDVADILSLARDVIEDNCLFKLEEDSRTLLICLRGGEERTVGN